MYSDLCLSRFSKPVVDKDGNVRNVKTLLEDLKTAGESSHVALDGAQCVVCP